MYTPKKHQTSNINKGFSMGLRIKLLKVVNITFLLLATTSCFDQKTIEQYQAEAENYINEDNNNGAIISLKNAIKLDPKNADVRLKLSHIYLNQGNYSFAEKELEKASDLGTPIMEVLPHLVEIKFKLRKYEDVYSLTARSKDLPDEQYAAVLTYAGLSALFENKRDEATKYIDKANEISAESVYSGIGKAYLSATKEDVDKSLKLVEEMISYAPEIVDTYLLKAYFLQSKKEYVLAAEAFEYYLSLRPEESYIQFFIAQNYLLTEQTEKTEAIVNELFRKYKDHALVNQMKSEVEFRRENYTASREYAVKAYQGNNNLPLSILIAGMSSYYLNDFEQSYQQLIKVKDRLPGNHVVHKVLVDLQLRLGYNDEAVESISQLVTSGQADASLLTAASHDLLKAGNENAAREMLKQSIELSSEKTNDLISQGFLKLKLNEFDTGVDLFEKALALDPESQIAESGVALGYLSASQFDEAVVIAKKWQNIESKKIQGLLLEAEIENRQGNTVKAKSLLKNVLTLDKHNVPALYKLAYLSHADGEIEQAFSLYKAVIERKQDHVRSLVNFARLISEYSDFAEDGINFYKGLLQKNDDNYVKLGLAYLYKVTGSHPDAIDLYTQITNSKTPIKGVEIALGDSYRAIGNVDSAVEVYKQYLSRYRGNLTVEQKLIDIYITHQKLNEGLSLINELQRTHTTNDGLVLYKLYFESMLNKTLDEKDIQLVQQSERLSEHWLFNKVLANQYLKNNQINKAVIELKEAYKKNAANANLIVVVRVMKLAGQKVEPIILEHTIKYPADNTAVIMLADEYLQQGKYENAKIKYQDLLIKIPNNFNLLNNLAYTELKLGDNTNALKHAEQAATLAPKSPSVLDTYAQSLAVNGKLAESLKVFEQALTIDRDNVEISINKAKVLINSNHTQEAKALLSGLSAIIPEEQEEIKALLSNLK